MIGPLVQLCIFGWIMTNVSCQYIYRSDELASSVFLLEKPLSSELDIPALCNLLGVHRNDGGKNKAEERRRQF